MHIYINIHEKYQKSGFLYINIIHRIPNFSREKHECTNIIKRYCVHHTYKCISISFILQPIQKTDVDVMYICKYHI